MRLICDPKQNALLKCRCGAIIELTREEYKEKVELSSFNNWIDCPCCYKVLTPSMKI